MAYTDLEIKNKVWNFLAQKREQDYWDIKQEWHNKIEDLIKDIICFANTVHNKDCYLIFGISDDLKVVGMSKERRKQSDIIDTLSNLQFAGDNIPQIEIKTVSLPSDFDKRKVVEIDVLIVYNTNNTPIYLKKHYGEMIQGCIYTRNKDKNTPNRGNAEIGEIEMLWKKRFGLTEPPLEYICNRLKYKLEWQQSQENWYNIYKPEYTIHIYTEEDIPYSDMFYAYSQANESMRFQMLEIIANNTVLKEYQLAILDGGRLIIPIPKWAFVNDQYSNDKFSYKYYIKDSHRHKLLEFLYNAENQEERYAFDNLARVILVFNNYEEYEDFNYYILCSHKEVKKRIAECTKYNHINTGDETKNAAYIEYLNTGIVLNELLSTFRQDKLWHK